jgi:hypothetical protein
MAGSAAMTARRTASIAVLVLALAACDSGRGEGRPSPSTTPTPTPTLSADQVELARLATLAARATYDATYTFTATVNGRTGALRIAASPPSYRVDVVTGGSTAVLITTPQRTVSCQVTSRKKSCFLVAGPGEDVPDLFDPGVQRLFSDAVADLAANPGRYTVNQVEVTLPAVATPSTCFQVGLAPEPTGSEASSPTPTPTTDADPTGFEAGQYCFRDSGLLTSLVVSTGRITLRSTAPAPPPSVFAPVAPVQTLPSLSPGPSPSRS